MKTASRIRVRQPAAANAFAERFSHLIKTSGLTLTQLAEGLGGYRVDTLLKISSGHARQISIDLLAAIAGWADDHGVSLAWLFAGKGEKDDAPPTTIKQSIQTDLLLAIARKLGVDI